MVVWGTGLHCAALPHFHQQAVCQEYQSFRSVLLPEKGEVSADYPEKAWNPG